MNQDDNPFQTKSLPSAHEAFGSNLNDDDDSDMPFRNYQKPIFIGFFYD
jgi:replicative DNA helicase